MKKDVSLNQRNERERLRLLEFQLDYLRAELLHLTHERYKMTYSVSGHIYRFLRPIEARVASWLGLEKNLSEEKDFIVDPPRRDNSATVRSLTLNRLLVDVTGTLKRDAGTGIQRVVKEVMRAFCLDQNMTTPVLAVRCENGRLFTAKNFTASLGGRESGPERELFVEPGDRFLMLSDSWNAFDLLAPAFGQIRVNGGEIISCVFDLIPELYPYACHEVTVPRYRAWLRRALIESDAFIAISKTVAHELADYVLSQQLPHRAGLKIGWFHCGADIVAPAVGMPSKKIVAATTDAPPIFLLVGTIEPRKGHRIALEAFDQLWSQETTARLIIVGRRGWFEEAVISAITTHEAYGRDLFWFDDATDADLEFLYRRAGALILPSYAEGFGLPIVEAARLGLSTICSDIPVFREVGGKGALYFRVNDPMALAATIKNFLAGALTTEPGAVLNVTWAQSARRIIGLIQDEDWVRRLP